MAITWNSWAPTPHYHALYQCMDGATQRCAIYAGDLLQGQSGPDTEAGRGWSAEGKYSSHLEDLIALKWENVRKFRPAQLT